ncbi:MAG TPA: hypothetical protein VLM76_14895 [Patescibacteria group bacterium]|nr:hypothetical protein [Patescibacteria group bacterium]
MSLQREHQHRPVTLVWLDANEAIVIGSERPAGDAVDPPGIRRVYSRVPPRHRAAGQVHRDPRVRSGGGADPDDLVELRRDHLIGLYLREVARLLPPDGTVVIMGPGPVHGRLAAEVRAADARHRRVRPIEAAAAGPLTERQLRARWRELSGSPPERRLPANAGAR